MCFCNVLDQFFAKCEWSSQVKYFQDFKKKLKFLRFPKFSRCFGRLSNDFLCIFIHLPLLCRFKCAFFNVLEQLFCKMWRIVTRVTIVTDKLILYFRHLKSLKGCTRLPRQWFSSCICDLLLFLPLQIWDQSQQLYPKLSRKINHYPFNPNQDLSSQE